MFRLEYVAIIRLIAKTKKKIKFLFPLLARDSTLSLPNKLTLYNLIFFLTVHHSIDFSKYQLSAQLL